VARENKGGDVNKELFGRSHRALRGVSAVLVGVIALAALLSAANIFATPANIAIPNPLAPPNTASPQGTVTSFQAEVTTGARIITAAFERHINSSGLFESDETRDAAATAKAHLARAARCLDLSNLPPATRAKVSTERVLMLGEVLERLPPLTEAAFAGPPDRTQWTIPNTEIRLARISTGPRAGEFLFTAETVDRIPEFYATLRARSDTDRFDFYQFYSLSPGDLMPPKWFGWIRALPSWMVTEYFDQALWQWIGYALTLAFFVVGSIALYLSARNAALRRAIPASILRLATPLGIWIGALLAEVMINELNITGPPFSTAHVALVAASYIAAAWFVAVVLLSLADWTASASGLRPQSIDAGMLRLSLRILGIAAGAGVLAYGASELGLPLVGIVAGLGVGGLAIALAAQPTIENFIGGVMIYADRPVRVGDFCKFGDISGTVEEIGIRSTRIRATDRSLITIPNGDFSKQRLVNTDRRDRLVVTGRIGLRYGTTRAQLDQILAEAMTFFRQHELIEEKNSSLRLIDFGALSLDLELVARLTTRNKDDLPGLREQILLQIADIVEKAGTGMAERA
jgi:MscS family membrane protein